MSFLEFSLFQNPLGNWLRAIGLAIGIYLVLSFLRGVLEKQLHRVANRTQNIWDDVIVRVVQVTRGWLMAIVAIWAGSVLLVMGSATRDALDTIAITAILAQIGVWGTSAIRAYTKSYADRNLEHDAASVMTVRAIGFLSAVGLWTIVFLVFLENLGIDVTALIAGLGIGGIAVALAAQNILSDLFASLSIVLDKPFIVGDFIIVDDMLGTVERVGLKTTRLRSLSGEQLVFSNADLLSSRIRNYKRMYERRIVFAFGVEYGTPREQLEWIPGKVREIVESLPDTRFDRAHFKGYGDSSLDFEVVYFVLVPDFNVYMDRQQSINLDLYRVFEERDIAFAFPTRTLHVFSHGGDPDVSAPASSGAN